MPGNDRLQVPEVTGESAECFFFVRVGTVPVTRMGNFCQGLSTKLVSG
jgi:hypothetical protein